MKVDLVFNTQGFFQLLKEFIADNIGDYISVKDNAGEDTRCHLNESTDNLKQNYGGFPPCESFYSHPGVTTQKQAESIRRFTQEAVCKAFGVSRHMIAVVADDKFLDRMRGHYRDAFDHRIPMKEAERRIAVERHHKDGGNVEFTLLSWNVPFWKQANHPVWRWDSFDYRIAEHCYCEGSLHMSMNGEPFRCVRCNLPRSKR